MFYSFILFVLSGQIFGLGTVQMKCLMTFPLLRTFGQSHYPTWPPWQGESYAQLCVVLQNFRCTYYIALFSGDKVDPSVLLPRLGIKGTVILLPHIPS